MSGTRIWLAATAAVAISLALVGCDNGPSAVARKPSGEREVAANDTRVASDEAYPDSSSSSAAEPRVDHRRDAVKLVDGKPMWSASRRYSASENARRAFERNGAAFGARDLDAFVEKAHDFVAHPPKGTLTMTRRNGDTLFYDPRGNVFAVASKDGAPRTMFHPDEGRAYWDEQKTRESRRQNAARRGREDDAD